MAISAVRASRVPMQSATSPRASLSCIRFVKPILLFSLSWPGSSRPFTSSQKEDVDARHRAGHDGSRRSVAIACVEFVEHAQVCRPVVAAAAGIVMLILLGGLLADCRGNLDQLLAGGFQPELNVRGIDEMLHQHEGFARTFSHGEKTVVVHDHGAVLTEVAVQTRALVEILRDALVGVVTDALIEADRLLGDHAKPAFEPGDRHAD